MRANGGIGSPPRWRGRARGVNVRAVNRDRLEALRLAWAFFLAHLVAAVADGDLTPAEAGELGKLIEAYVRALEATDFAARLENLERANNR